MKNICSSINPHVA